jgi:poly-gamma-glutamate capsule biosynthesis protein CapA/YwtB (metallophosphatase superfamily)
MNPDGIKILITGDFCPINRIEALALKRNFEAIYNDFIDILRGNDLTITDLECALTVSQSVRPKTGPYQKAHPDCIKALAFANIGLVALANNHIMDYDATGAIDTLQLCGNNGIATVGIGRTMEEAGLPFSAKIKNKKVAILNFADNEFLSATDNSIHCNPVNPIQCAYDIHNARMNHDYLIVIMHAGNEFYALPSPRTKKLYRYIIDQGADVIVSHHTHAYSGYEIYQSKPIFYGLGNFIYDWPGKINSGWNQGYVVRLLLSDKTDFEIIPLNQCNEKPGVSRLNDEENKTFQDEISRMNLIINDDQQLEAEFQKYCKKVLPMYEAFLEPNFGKYITSLRKRGLFPRLLSKKKKLLLLNLARCESHRDVLMRTLTNP